MKFSIEWLKKFIAVQDSAAALAAKITDAGLEVEACVGDVLEIAIPPNRADCLGMVGLARDIAAIIGVNFNEPEIKPVPATSKEQIKLNVAASTACPKYLGRVIKGIDNTKQTPQWIKDCLTTAEVNLVSPVVDITNFVLLEWGQPLHAFDLNKLDGGVAVRYSIQGEELTLLDESHVELDPQTLIIADQKQPLAIAGVKGGKYSGIAASTKDILLECAYFSPIGVRLTSRHYGLKTDGSYRFERCIDPAMQERVMEHATRLILDIVGGEAGPIVSFIEAQHLPKNTDIILRCSRINKILGIAIDIEQVKEILLSLGMQLLYSKRSDELVVKIPSFRADISLEIDLIEEIVRIYGYNNIPMQATISTLDFQPRPEGLIPESQILSSLANRGYNEAITYSFIDAEYARMFSNVVHEALFLNNPISSEMNLMRPSLLPGLIKTVMYNQNRQQNRIRLFEIGLRFVGEMENLQQIKTIAGVCYGAQLPENWANRRDQVDLYDIKGDVLALFKLAQLDSSVTFHPVSDSAMYSQTMHPQINLAIKLAGQTVGKLGALHPKLQQTCELPNEVYMFELDYAAVVNGKVMNFAGFSKFPAVRRDLAVLISNELPAAELEHSIKQQIGAVLDQLLFFDVYKGKGIPAGQKSMGIGLILQHADRTLTDDEVNVIVAQVVELLKSDYKATLR